MKVSMNWISEYVDLSGLDVDDLIRRFTLSTAEVEEVYHLGTEINGVVVAEITKVEEHPNSKKLHLLELDLGETTDRCVCGAPNVRVGLRVPFAPFGASVVGMTIGEATIAGVVSRGMCCSAAELGIADSSSGLLELPGDAPLGKPVKELYAFEDVVFEVDNKSLTNRPDLWGHYGIAREFSAIAKRPLKPLALQDLSAYDALPAVPLGEIDPELCYRYSAIRADGITKKVSPIDMQIRLYYCGMRAISLLADLTNYVMLELGQPTHAFDSRMVGTIGVQRFKEPFAFQTLDGTERKIDPETLMITSDGKPVAVAGVMGGLNSEIVSDTDSVTLECATFSAVSVRKTSSRIGLRTDASMRYEKTLDPALCALAAGRFLKLLLSIDPGAQVASRYTDCCQYRYPEIELHFTKAFVDRYTGIDISDEQIEDTLARLGFGVTRSGSDFDVKVPSWRATKDVTIPADVIGCCLRRKALQANVDTFARQLEQDFLENVTKRIVSDIAAGDPAEYCRLLLGEGDRQIPLNAWNQVGSELKKLTESGSAKMPRSLDDYPRIPIVDLVACSKVEKMRLLVQEAMDKCVEGFKRYIPLFVKLVLLENIEDYVREEEPQRRREIEDQLLRMSGGTMADVQDASDYLERLSELNEKAMAVRMLNCHSQSVYLLISDRTYGDWNALYDNHLHMNSCEVFNYHSLEEFEFQSLMLTTWDRERYERNRERFFRQDEQVF